MSAESLARRLAQLEGVSLSADDLESIVRELQEYDRALPELEAFAEGVDWQRQWPSAQVQPGRD